MPANEAGERQDGFVSAVDGVAGLAGAEGVLAFDKVSGSDDAELAKAGLADPELADPELADSGPANAELADPELTDSGPADPDVADPVLADIVLPDATTGSGAEAPSGLAGMSGWPLPLERDSSGGGIAALGIVTSERLPPCATVTGDESPLCWAESSADVEPGPDRASDSEGEPDAEPVPFFAWTAVVAVDDAREERGAVSVVLVLVVLTPASSAGAFAPTSRAS